MKKTFLEVGQKLINTYLNADQEVAERLQSYVGKSILIQLTDLEFSFSINIAAEGILLTEQQEEGYTTKISGRSFSLLRLVLNKGPVNHILNEAGIEIAGDVLFLQSLRDIFTAVEVDWEDILAPYLGDIVARQAGNALRKIKQVAIKNRELFRKNLSTYLQEELQVSPSQQEVRVWYDDVATLRNDVERAEARLERLL